MNSQNALDIEVMNNLVIIEKFNLLLTPLNQKQKTIGFLTSENCVFFSFLVWYKQEKRNKYIYPEDEQYDTIKLDIKK